MKADPDPPPSQPPSHPPSQPPSQRLMIFAKAPMPGRVKTRLRLPPERAAAVHAAFVRDVVARHQRPGRAVTLWRAGDLDHPLWSALVEAHALTLAVQPAGDLGDRMRAAFTAELTHGARVVILGTDSPTLPPRLVDAAFAALEHAPVAVGPAADGGYYLMALRAPAGDAVFDALYPADMKWGTEEVLPRTLDRLAAAGLPFRVLDPWYDIDRPADLAFAAHHIPSLIAAGDPAPGHTMRAVGLTAPTR